MNMEWKICIIFVSINCIKNIFCINSTISSHPPPFSEKMIKLVNAAKTTWTAGRNFPMKSKYLVTKTLAGTIMPDPYHAIMASDGAKYNTTHIPATFDARKIWKNCSTLFKIRDQGICASSWAVAPAAAMSDRFCIQSNAKYHYTFSAADIHTCCINKGCKLGGYISLAWQYWNIFGVVSGGSYNSSYGCKPYAIPPRKYLIYNSTTKLPICAHICEKSYKRPYKKDKRFALRVYTIKGGENQIKGEIMTRGPVTATFQVFTDFLSYKKGVYKQKFGELMGSHTVKLLGWGILHKTPYWLAANSWGELWGDRGFFKILRGRDHCGIESLILGGEPSYAKHVARTQFDLNFYNKLSLRLQLTY